MFETPKKASSKELMSILLDILALFEERVLQDCPAWSEESHKHFEAQLRSILCLLD